MAADLVYLVAGLSLILAVVLPAVLKRALLTSPMLLIGLGMLLGLTPLPDGLPLDPQENRAAIEHVTELTVIVALMGVGLALDRPLSFRSRASWRAWSPGEEDRGVHEREGQAVVQAGLGGQREPDLVALGLGRGVLLAAAFFGVRGVGSIYYLAYAGGEVEAFQDDWLWSTVGFTIVLSVVVHGALAGPVMTRLECRRSGAVPAAGEG